MIEREFTCQTDEYVNVRKRLSELSCLKPRGLVILPSNFESANSIAEFRMPSEAITVRKLLHQADVPCGDIVDKSVRIPYVMHRSMEITIPMMFFSAVLWDNLEWVNIVVDTVTAYVTDFFLGLSRAQKVNLEIVLEEPDGSCKRVTYEGPPSSIGEIKRIIKELKQ